MLKYNEISRGAFIYRTKNADALSGIWGRILCVEGHNENGIIVRKTSNCVAYDDPLVIPNFFDDGCWYDVSTLVYQANAAVYPPTDKGTFLSSVAQNYRNFLNLDYMQPMSLDEAIGRVCFIGAVKNGRLMFTRNACYVVDYDNNGWVAVYNGYAEPVGDNTEVIPPELCMYYFGGGTRRLYPADEIINACNDAYEEDIGRAADYSIKIKQSIVASSNEATAVRGEIASIGVLAGMKLED